MGASRKLHGRIRVPSRPSWADSNASGVVIIAGLFWCCVKSIAASIFGPMLPGGKWPSTSQRCASLTVISDSSLWLGVPYPKATRRTSVSITSRSACRPLAKHEEARSLSMTASTPRSLHPRLVTGMPPPPAVITTNPFFNEFPNCLRLYDLQGSW